MSGYETEVVAADTIQYWLTYSNSDKMIGVDQLILNCGLGARLNTENAMVMPMEVTINGWTGLYFQNFQGTHFYMLNTGVYLISYISNMDKAAVEEIITATNFK